MTQELRIDTANIRHLRELLGSNDGLFASINQFVQLRVVIDANFVISDLLQKINHPERGKTALEELIRASVIEVHAPRWLEKDLASAIQQVSNKGKVTEAQLRSAWSDYQPLIKWDERWDKPPKKFKPTDDPKDLPYVLLAEFIGAHGVLSNDHDIERMGGNRLSLDFVLSTRQYARAAVVSVSISVSGKFVGVMAIESLARVMAAIKSNLAKLSPKWKLVLLGAAVFVVLHPRSRAWLIDLLRKFGPTARVVLETVTALATLEAKKREDAKAHLTNVYATAKLSIDQT